ncbi:MAG TPA: GNAT family N-acetyltransferase [Polyangiales bacterium]|nr:GNAT family N-acetyltransferase [Polyangiales bacterium]
MQGANKQGQPLEIRELARDDLDALLALYAELDPDDDPLPERAELERIWDGIRGDRDRIYLGGFADGRLVAACNATVIPNLTRGARPYAVIENVITAADQRRRGHGKRLMRALIERCLARNCYKVSLTSGVQRESAHSFYVALGFDPDAKRAFVLKAR